MKKQRTVFFVSESTGITAEAVGHSLLSQFEDVDFSIVYMPYTNTRQKAMELARQFQEITESQGAKPLVFATMLDLEIGQILRSASCMYMELFDTFMTPLSRELGIPPTLKSGKSHGLKSDYDARINSINFAMASDDGMRLDNYPEANVILIGVSRSGKTPTCLYLAMHFGLRAANYPLTQDDFDRGGIPKALQPFSDKLVGLTIDPYRLTKIRQGRRPGSDYASLERCQSDVRNAIRIFDELNVKVIDTTSQSIEEISTRIVKLL